MSKKGIIHFLPMVIITSVIIAVIGGIFYFNFASAPDGQNSGEDSTVESPSPNIEAEEIDTSEWESYKSDLFSIKYPSELETRIEASPYDESYESLTVVKIGPTQREGTEVYDGFIISIYPFENTESSLSSLVDLRVKETESIGQVLEEPSEITLNGVNGIAYTAQGLGDFKHIFVEKNGVVFQISMLINADPEGLGYEKQMNDILSTFEFVE